MARCARRSTRWPSRSDAELNGAADNPLVLAADDEILSNGNFHVPALPLALDAAAIAVAQVAATRGRAPGAAAHPARQRAAGQPGRGAGPTHAGVSPLLKTAQSLTLEIRHRAAPLAIHATVSAEGVEDDSTGATQAALRLREQLRQLSCWSRSSCWLPPRRWISLAARSLGRGTEAAQRCVRELVAAVDRRPAARPRRRSAWPMSW